MSDPPGPTSAPQAPAPIRRWIGASLASLLLFLGGPGILGPDGSALLALAAIGVWGAVVSRPLGPHRWRALLAEWLGLSLGWGLVFLWVRYVTPPGVLVLAFGYGAYTVLAGVLLRAFRRRLPLVWAVPLAWSAAEVLRCIPRPPFGMQWLLLGHHLHAQPLLAGAARLAGPEGLSFVLALGAGLVSTVLVERRLRPRAALPAAAGLVACLAASALTRPPAADGALRVLLVQPGFEQERKQFDDPRTNFLASRALTLAALERSDGPPVDLVCWGESMLYVPLVEPEVAQAVEQGLRTPAWGLPLTADGLERLRSWEEDWVHGGLFGRGAEAGLPPGTAFLVGAEVFRVHDGQIRRANGVVLYDAAGERGPAGAKRFLVPGAETMMGLERFAAVRATIERVAGYVPDFVPAERTSVLTLETRSGRSVRLGASVCYDNGFLEPYVDPLRDGPVDLHVVVSNEAWYLTSWEMDQMVALSRIAALATGRSIVRATNSGISLVLGPDGRELDRVRDASGADRAVGGTLLVDVPLPAAGEADRPTPYVRVRTLLRWGVLALAVALLAAFRTSAGNPARNGG